MGEGRKNPNTSKKNCRKKNHGKLIMDATVAPADVKFSTDIDLLNRCREHLETAINLHWPEFPHTFPYTGDDMTTVFFVRHAAPNLMNHDDLTRELSAKGLRDRLLVTEFLQTKRIDFVFSSPYRRAVETISDFAEKRRLEISLVNDFRERKVGNGWINNFDEFCQRQWNDFSFKLDDGEPP